MRGEHQQAPRDDLLRKAAGSGARDRCAQLAREGASPTSAEGSKLRESALHKALKYGQLDVIGDLLLRTGRDELLGVLHAENATGATPLELALQHGQDEALLLALKHEGVTLARPLQLRLWKQVNDQLKARRMDYIDLEYYGENRKAKDAKRRFDSTCEVVRALVPRTDPALVHRVLDKLEEIPNRKAQLFVECRDQLLSAATEGVAQHPEIKKQRLIEAFARELRDRRPTYQLPHVGRGHREQSPFPTALRRSNSFG